MSSRGIRHGCWDRWDGLLLGSDSPDLKHHEEEEADRQHQLHDFIIVLNSKVVFLWCLKEIPMESPRK